MLDERLHVRVVVVLIHAEFRDPERPSTTDIVRLGDILLEVDFIVGARIPVDRDKVDGAAGAIAQEFGEIG